MAAVPQANDLFPTPREFAAKARINSLEQYRELYARSIRDPDGFWAEQAERIHWFRKWDTVSKQGKRI